MFAPVIKSTAIRGLLLPLPSYLSGRFDKAYLHGTLEEDLYMRVPESSSYCKYARKVLKLDRALYALEQTGQLWNHRIHATFKGLVYQRTKSDACIYMRSKGGL